MNMRMVWYFMIMNFMVSKYSALFVASAEGLVKSDKGGKC